MALGFKPSGNEKGKGSGRKRGGQDGHPGANRNLLPVEQCAEVIPQSPVPAVVAGRHSAVRIENRIAIR